MTRESDYFKQYEQVLDDMIDFEDRMATDEQEMYDADMRSQEMKEFERLAKQKLGINDAFYEKREERERLKKTGGVKSESHIWKDDE